MGAMDARNMYSNLAANKYLHTVASCWISSIYNDINWLLYSSTNTQVRIALLITSAVIRYLETISNSYCTVKAITIFIYNFIPQKIIQYPYQFYILQFIIYSFVNYRFISIKGSKLTIQIHLVQEVKGRRSCKSTPPRIRQFWREAFF